MCGLRRGLHTSKNGIFYYCSQEKQFKALTEAISQCSSAGNEIRKNPGYFQGFQSLWKQEGCAIQEYWSMLSTFLFEKKKVVGKRAEEAS